MSKGKKMMGSKIPSKGTKETKAPIHPKMPPSTLTRNKRLGAKKI